MDKNIKELDLEELETVAGGMELAGMREKTAVCYCNTCKKKTDFVVFTGTRGRCKVCGNIQEV